MSEPKTNGDLLECERLMRGHRAGILTTLGADGHFHSRPMALPQHLSAKELWFATSADSTKVHDLEAEPQCALALHGGGSDATYVSLSGVGEVVRDPATLREKWEPGWRPYFPDGPGAKELVLIRFRPEHIEYVHPTTGRLHVLYTRAKQLLTRTREPPAPKRELDLQ